MCRAAQVCIRPVAVMIGLASQAGSAKLRMGNVGLEGHVLIRIGCRPFVLNSACQVSFDWQST